MGVKADSEWESEGERILVDIELDDLRLARAVRRDPRAAETVARRLYPRVYQSVRLLVNRDHDDFAQLCVLEILKSLHKYRGTGSLEAWAWRIATRVIMKQLQKTRRYERTITLAPESRAVSPQTPERELWRTRAREKLAEHMARQPPERRITLVLRLVHEHSVAEVAELTGVSVNTAKDRLRVGLSQLRESLSADPVFKSMRWEGIDD